MKTQYYSYMYNVDGTDYLNPAVFQLNKADAEQIHQQTKPDEEAGSPIIIDQPRIFKATIEHVTTKINHYQQKYQKNLPVYLSYYYQPKDQQYYLIPKPTLWNKDQAYEYLAEYLITHHLNQNFTLDLDADDLSNTLIENECDVITLIANDIFTFQHRLQLEN